MLKNVGGVAILVTEIEQKAQMEILLILGFFGHKIRIFRDI